jgi:hypothetical protein
MRFAIILLALAPIVAIAQPLIPHRESLDAQALNCRYILVGTVVKVRAFDKGTGLTAAVIHAEEWVKGMGISENTEFELRADVEEVEKWRDGKARLMVFHDARPVVLSDPALEEWTADLRILRRPEDVIKAVRRAVRAAPNVFGIETFTRMAPGREDQLRVSVPADASLEKWALSTLKSSKDQVQRADAARALGYFRSDANIARLRELLTDEGTVSTNEGELYLVRIRAFYSLQMLGVDVPKPVEIKR